MRPVSSVPVVLLVIGLVSCQPGPQPNQPARPIDVDSPRDDSWHLKSPAPGAKAVAANKRLPGIYPVGSRIRDDKALGGFGPCDNFPLDLGKNEWGANGAISLVAFPDEPIAYFKHQGLAVRLINRTSDIAAFSACDSCLYLVQEALDDKGRWREIEETPDAICGNSFHRVFIKANEYWEFKARTYTGSIKTKVRFRLDPGGENPGQPIFSNEFAGHVAPAQFRAGKE